MPQNNTTTLVKKDSWTSFLKLVRWQNLMIIVFTQYMVKIFLISPQQPWLTTLQELPLLIISSSTVIVAAAGYIINDYYDIKIDRVNKPKRIVIGRLIKRRVALGAHFTLNFIGIGLGVWLSLKVGVINFIAGFLLWLYSNQLKRLPLVGNAAIAVLTAMVVIVMAVYYEQQQLSLFTFATFAFFITIIREIIKDMEDVRGDATFGCKTLPIVWGMRRTKNVIYVFLGILTAILLSTLFVYRHLFILYLVIFVLPSLFFLFIRLRRADTKKEYRYLSHFCKFIMLIGVLSMVLVF
ncbi:geranylgeranylglycerol-phosphate geranylgeranyltransferase [Microscilla marina]|uniref:Prenyltransferase 2 n=1 Tax=Microscilla marina ATCC 23134 TaxID=313606 RepID=A1ZQX8_MICM2|nr:geranylgeranylglycerol-phosphate geranylgeranyltransferase [Microscilla marina]EAY27283.1 prenyltransferase 2 [Microscilla marina ATCC 23134]